MDKFIQPLARLINELSRLPGVGKRSAQRYAYAILAMTDTQARTLAESITDAKTAIKYCQTCGNFTDIQPCGICASRSHKTVCAVKEPKDVAAFERLREFKGTYHVLHGTLNPLDGVTPDDIRIKELLARVAEGKIEEVIMATNPDVEGEATAMYIARLLRPLGVKVTRLAHGIPMGSEVEYADEVTLSRALTDRKPI